MKRQGHLIADYENLLWAYWKAQRGKKAKAEVLAYGQNLETNLNQLQLDILNGTCEIGNYNFFKIYEPKERQICAANFSERVLHHAIMNVCHQSFENFQVFDSYATRQNKGTYAAIDRAMFFQKKFPFYMKIDCKKYFDSIDHAILKSQLYRRFKDEKLLTLMFQIIDSYNTNLNKGLPIGNLTSQYFANHYLAHADRYLTETLKIPAMVRYMDDLILWHHDKIELAKVGELFKSYCSTHLKLNFKHQYQNRTEFGVSFLGGYLWKNHITLNRSSKQRLINKYKCINNHFNADMINEQTYHIKLMSLAARPIKVRSYRFRQQLFWNINEREITSGRQLLQQCAELPFAESQQESPRQPQQQHRLSASVFPQLNNLKNF